MNGRRIQMVGCAAGSLLMAMAASSVAEKQAKQMEVKNASEMRFANIPGVPTCLQASVQTGDPSATEFILLGKTTTGCRVPWHWHSANEHLMIVSGKAQIGVRDPSVPATHTTLTAGGFALLPATHVHEFTCRGSCSFYLYSDGKFDIHYVDPNGKEIAPEDALKPLKETVAMR